MGNLLYCCGFDVHVLLLPLCAGERGSSSVLFVRNLSYDVDEGGLKDAFPSATAARIAKFQDTQKPRG